MIYETCNEQEIDLVIEKIEHEWMKGGITDLKLESMFGIINVFFVVISFSKVE